MAITSHPNSHTAAIGQTLVIHPSSISPDLRSFFLRVFLQLQSPEDLGPLQRFRFLLLCTAAWSFWLKLKIEGAEVCAGGWAWCPLGVICNCGGLDSVAPHCIYIGFYGQSLIPPAWGRLEGDLPASFPTPVIPTCSLCKTIQKKQEFLTETRCVVV